MVYGVVCSTMKGVVFTKNALRKFHDKNEVTMALTRVKPGGLWRLEIHHGPITGPMVDMEALMEGLQQRAWEQGMSSFYTFTNREEF